MRRRERDRGARCRSCRPPDRCASAQNRRWKTRSAPENYISRPAWTLGSRHVESIQIHDLAPGGHEVTRELLFRVVRRVDFREGAELRVRTEDKVDPGTGPSDLAG